MVNNFKTTSLAAITAAITLLGSGSAWALEVTTDSQGVVGVGCDPLGFPNRAVIWNQTAAQGLVGIIGPGLYQYLPGSPSFDPNRQYRSSVESATDWQALVEVQCPNLTDMNIELYDTGPSFPEGTPEQIAAFEAEDYVGVVFTARDSRDGQYYRHEWAVSGVTDTQVINTRTPIPAPDNEAPTVEFSDLPAVVSGTDPFTITVTFSEDVVNFNDPANDVSITNGIATAIVPVSASVYMLTIAPDGGGDVGINVLAGVAQDNAGNDNTAAETMISSSIVADTQEDIAAFMLGRANNLASNQPGLTRFLMGNRCGPEAIAPEIMVIQDDSIYDGNKLDLAQAVEIDHNLTANITESGGAVDGCVSRGNTWAELTSSWSENSSYTLGSAGVHRFINPDVIVGGMVQFDSAEDDVNAISGTGWMAGPYFVAKVPEQPFYIEGRALYGQTDNDITPSGTYTDSFETERWLAQLRATGEYQVQSITLMPLLDFTSTSDNQQSYTDGLGNSIPSQTVTLTQLTTGVDFSMPLSVQTGSLQLTGGLSGIYASTDGGAATPTFEDWRARTELDLTYGMENGTTFSAGAFYDGLGGNYEAYGATFSAASRF